MKKLKVLFIALALGIIATACGAADKGEVNEERIKEDITYKQISAEKAMEFMETEKEYIILDVRTQEEYDEKHIPGAVLVPNESIGESEIEELPDKDQMILVYCRSGNRSKQASEKLAKLGYTNVYEFGGINNWTGEVE